MYKIEINNKRKIQAIQNEFNEFFPHLKIEFFNIHRSAIYNQIKEYVDGKSNLLVKCRERNNDGFLFLDEDIKANELKETFYKDFGLNIDIFHKIGKDSWSKDPVPNNQILKEINFEIH